MKKLNTDGNLYTLIYATIIVVIVAILLSTVNQVLKDRQQANVLLDKQKQILVALNMDFSQSNPAKLYYATVVDTVVRKGDVDKNTDFAYYIAEVNGEKKYVIPLRGQGLWGAIWGYIALNDDKNTVFGINFGHESETPGLGGEIVTANFRNRFIGKRIQDAQGELRSIAVLKSGKKADAGQEQVDAWAGATITSTGVSDMLYNTLMEYKTFIETVENKQDLVEHSAKEED